MTLILTLTIISILLILIWLGIVIVESQTKKLSTGGKAGMIGEFGKAFDDFVDNKGKIICKGEFWNSFSDESIKKGDVVEVTDMSSLILTVKKSDTKKVF